MSPDALIEDFKNTFDGAKFSAGLLVSFVDLLTDIGATDGTFEDFASLCAQYPLKETNAQGRPIKQLELQVGERRAAIRSSYNKIETYFRAEKKRFDYPSAPGHATGAWRGYTRWLDALVTFSPEELAEVRAQVIAHVLDTLPAHEVDPTQLRRDPPLFERVLTDFDLTPHPGEKTGAALQGIAFGFLRADNPHLQIEVDKVRAGGRRLGRIGDVAGWSGDSLSIAAEVKDYRVKNTDLLEDFAADIAERSAMGLVVASDFSPEARESLAGKALIPLSIDDMLNIVRLWDPQKQRIAADSALYFFARVEKSSSLTERLKAFLDANADPLAVPAHPPEDAE